MKIVLKQQAFFALLLSAASFLAAQDSATENSGGDSGSTLSAGYPADLSVTALVEAANGLSLRWRPDWPLSVPPDLFYTLPESSVAAITASFEAPKERFAEQAGGDGAEAGKTEAGKTGTGSVGTGKSEGESAGEDRMAGAVIVVEWQNGRLIRFPVFDGSSFIQTKAEYNASGILSGLTGENFEIAFFESVVRIQTGNSYFFAVAEYDPGHYTETWYDENGLPQSVFVVDKTGNSVTIHYGENGAEAETRRFFFNSFDSISAINAPEGTWSAQYERRGFPRYLERDLGTGTERYSFQWDEAGRLTRLSAVTEDGRSADSRFEYDLDDRGNWIVRREITMTNLSGRLFPGPGVVVRRRIQYGARP
jgi:hypothetical protein